VVETAVLERLCVRNGTEGSNPSLSAATKKTLERASFLLLSERADSNAGAGFLSRENRRGGGQTSRERRRARESRPNPSLSMDQIALSCGSIYYIGMAKSTPHPSSSETAKMVGEELIKRFGKRINKELIREGAPKSFSKAGGTSIKIDGYSEKILCEAWAHIGKLKGAQSSKIAKDALKLIYVEKKSGGKFRKIILFVKDEKDEARQSFRGSSWMSDCLKRFDIELEVEEIPKELKAELLKDQIRQKR
jgi:hypothetical protein